MGSAVIATEWLNQNSLRNYPFREDCGLRPNDSAGALISDGWRIPNYLVVDLVLGVSGSEYSSDLYLKSMSVIDRSVALIFAASDGTNAFTVGSTGDKTVEVAGVGNFADVRGVIHFGDLERFFDETPEGLYKFSVEETLVEPTCIRPSAAAIRSLAVVDATGYTTARLVGDVKLVAGENIHIKYDKPHNAIIISADPSSGYTDECDCATTEPYFVKTINGISTENVILKGDDCVQVDTTGGVITITDKCSKPCCGCAETAFINQVINDLSSSVNTLNSNATVLAERITNFVNNYLLARKTLV